MQAIPACTSTFSSLSCNPVLVNFDESNGKLVMTADRTVAERGAESVKRFVNGNAKASCPFFAFI
jgi:hypothetical protein